jgi:hypothetical protein
MDSTQRPTDCRCSGTSSFWTDFLLKADVDREWDYAPVLTAGERVELVASGLIPPD